jgi:hypothetical protein
MNRNYISIKFGFYFGIDTDTRIPLGYEDIIKLLYTESYLEEYNYLFFNAKRGDLLINFVAEHNRNYNVYIIDIINDTIVIKYLDYDNGYEGYPKVPIEFLDILLINNNFWYNSLNMNEDYELDKYSIELSYLTDDDFIFNLNINNIIHNNIILLLNKYNLSYQLYKLIYTFIENPLFWNIKNTKCFVNKKDLTNLIKYIDYKNNNHKLINFTIVNNLFYITL